MADAKKHHAQSFFNGVVEVMNDIRHKVIEEPWLGWSNGRTVTGDIPEAAVETNQMGDVNASSKAYHQELDRAGHESYFEYADNPTPVDGIFNEDWQDLVREPDDTPRQNQQPERENNTLEYDWCAQVNNTDTGHTDMTMSKSHNTK